MNVYPPQYVTRVQLLHVIFSALVLIELSFAPGRLILFSFVEVSLYQMLPTPVRHLGVFFVTYWVPAVFVYFVLVLTSVGTWLKINRSAIRPLQVANIVFIVFLAIRAFPTSALGGLMQFVAPLVVYPAVLAILFGFVRLFVLNIRERGGVSQQVVRNRIRPCARDIGVSSAALAIPLSFGIYAGFSAASPIPAALRIDPLFEKKCEDAGEEVLVFRDDARSIFFPKGSKPVFSGRISNGFLRSAGMIIPHNTILVEYEVDYVEIEHMHSSPAEGRGWYIRMDGDLISEPNYQTRVEEPDSDYAVYTKTITSDADKAMGLVGQTMKIVDQKTDEVVATSTYFIQTEQKRFCGYAPGDEFSQSAFVARALNLKPRSR